MGEQIKREDWGCFVSVCRRDCVCPALQPEPPSGRLTAEEQQLVDQLATLDRDDRSTLLQLLRSLSDRAKEHGD